MDGVELALKRHAAHPTLIRDTEKFFDKCAQRLKAASNSASEKLAALEKWREDGLLGDTQAFDDLIDELIFEPAADQANSSIGAGQNQEVQDAAQDALPAKNQHTNPAAAGAGASSTAAGRQSVCGSPEHPASPPPAGASAATAAATPATPAAAAGGVPDSPAPADAEANAGAAASAAAAILSVPLTAEVIYEAAKQYRLQQAVPQLVPCRDEQFKRTVQRVPFQEQAVAMMLQHEQNPQQLQLTLGGEQYWMPSGSLLFDRMGLGKTIQAINLMLANPRVKGLGGTLVLAPTIITCQWAEEIHVHSRLSVLLYTGLAKHMLGQVVGLSQDAEGPLEELSPAALKRAHENAQSAARVAARAQGLNPKAAAAAVEKPAFSSLRDKFKAAIQQYDVVIMSFEDALAEARYLEATVRRSGRNAGSSTSHLMRSPLMEVDFKRLIVDETQQLGTSATKVFSLASKVKAHHKMVMSGTPLPPGREAALLEAQLRLLFTSTGPPAGGAAAAAAAGASHAGCSSGTVPDWLHWVVTTAMMPQQDLEAAQDAQQALLQLVPPLLIRRTHQEVVCEGYTVPAQHHSVVEVQPQFCCGYIMQLLKQAAAKRLEAAGGDEAAACDVRDLYNRLAGASSHPQFDGMSRGGGYMLDAAGAFVDPVLPLRVGPCTEICPQDVMAEILHDALQLYTVKCAVRLASAAHELTVRLSSGETPNLPEARGVVRSVLDVLQSQLPIYDPSTDARQPLTLQQLDDRRSSSSPRGEVPSYAATAAQRFTFRRDKAFANYRGSRTLYLVAVQDFTTSMACLKRLQTQLNAPAAAVSDAAPAATAAAGGGSSGGGGASSAAVAASAAAGGSEGAPLALAGLSVMLADAVDALQEELQQLDAEAPSAQQVQQLGGTEQQWQQLVAAANSRLDPQHMVAWFTALKQQRDVFLAAVRDLQNTPTTDQGLVPASELARYADLLAVATAAEKAYGERLFINKAQQLLQSIVSPSVVSNLQYTSGRKHIWDILHAVMLELLGYDGLRELVAGWKDTAGQLDRHESAAARAVLRAAEKVYSASQKLAPRTSGKTVAALEGAVDDLMAQLQQLVQHTHHEVQGLVDSTRQLAQAAASSPVKSAELKYGSLVAKVMELLTSDELKDKQVVVAAVTKPLYLEIVNMLWHEHISHEQLGPTTWVQNGIKMCGYVQHKRARQKALEAFKKKEARVLVLDLLGEEQAFGITLTNAHHMIVCDPVIKEPVLHQLLSRVHRYGQKHEQHVTFLVVRGSFNSLLHDRLVSGFARRFIEQGPVEPEAASAEEPSGGEGADDDEPAAAAAGAAYGGGAGRRQGAASRAQPNSNQHLDTSGCDVPIKRC